VNTRRRFLTALTLTGALTASAKPAFVLPEKLFRRNCFYASRALMRLVTGI